MFDNVRHQLNQTRDDAANLDLAQRQARARLKSAERAISQARQANDQDSLARLEQEAAGLRGQVEQLQGRRAALGNALHDLSNQYLEAIGPVRDRIPGVQTLYPVALLPVRLETRFMTGRTGGAELWVRIYPDDIAIETHETPLTEEENQLARGYWDALHAAGADEDHKKAAWGLLVESVGVNRAAYLARMMQPAPGPDGEWVFPEVELRDSAWSQPARTRVLPDRFVVMTYQGGRRIHTQAGRLVPSPLIVGPDPLEGPAGTRLIPADGRLELPPELQWLVDFDAAETAGMALRIPLTPEQARAGFDQVLALGVRMSADAVQSALLLQSLFDSHHYTEGLSLVPTGTPTNITGGGQPAAAAQTAAQAIEDSWRVEQSEPLFTPQRLPGSGAPDLSRQSDGERLAEALGLPYATFQHIRHADNTDAVEARAMNDALFPATLGYFLRELIAPRGQEAAYADAIRQLRRFMVDYVSGRGPLAAFRVGDQPYGVVLATASPRFWENRLRGTGMAPKVVENILQTWDNLSRQVARVGFGSDPDQTMLDILALHPSAMEYYQRHASTGTVSRNYLVLNALGETAISAEEARVARAQILLDRLKLEEILPSEIMALLWFRRAALLDGPAVDAVPLSEVKGLSSAFEDGNYIDWILQQDVAALRDSDFGLDEQGNPRPVPRALLFLLLSQAMQREQIDTANRLRGREGQSTFLKESHIVNVKALNERTPWHNLAEPLAISGNRPLGHYLMTANLSGVAEAGDLEAIRAALRALSPLSTARLERLLAEHLDLCSYRADAWLTGLLYQQLSGTLRRIRADRDAEDVRAQRSGGRGVYLGAYGYLENLRPAPPRQPVPRGEIPAGFEEGPPLVYAPGNQGYIHAPSLGQATAAAVLRNARLTHAASPNRDQMAVNLSSERVRRAQWFLEGMRAGQSAAALLGYQFERGLHDRGLDVYLLRFRDKFPFALDPAKPPPAPGTPVEALEARNVVNGQALVKAQLDGGFPYGIPSLNAISAADKAALRELVADVADSLDAVADLTLAESVYQMAHGRHERAAAVLDATNRGGYPPEMEFVRTPRGGSTLEVGVGLVLSSAIPGALQWNAAAPRVAAEPRLNAWLDGLLGDPAAIRVLAEVDGQPGPVELHAGELGLSAVDFVHLAEESHSDTSPLERRVVYALRRREGLADALAVRLEIEARAPGWSPAVRSFFEVLPLARALRWLVGECRALHAPDLLPRQASSGDEGDRRRIDLAELEARATAARTALQQARDGLATALAAAGPASLPALDGLRAALLSAAALGLPDDPSSATGGGEQVFQSLAAQAEGALSALDERIAAAAEAFGRYTALPVAQADRRADELQAVFEAVFGGVVRVLPLFQPANAPQIAQSLAAQGDLLDGAPPLAVDRWLHGLTRVRERVSWIEEVRLFADLMDQAVLSFTPLQTPHTPAARWYPLAPVAGLPGDAKSLALILPGAYDPAASQCGLLIDDWVEVIPNAEETTGLTMHFDQPNAEPPQAVLLALPAVANDENWTWDDLANTVLEAMRLARIRLVDPDQIDRSDWAQFLPALVSAVSSGKVTAGLDLYKNVELKVKR